MSEAVEPTVGMPATINLYSDTSAAVVIKVNAKSIVVARVATDESTRRRLNDAREPFPVWAEDGILTEVTGEPQRYLREETRDGPRFRNGSITRVSGPVGEYPRLPILIFAPIRWRTGRWVRALPSWHEASN